MRTPLAVRSWHPVRLGRALVLVPLAVLGAALAACADPPTAARPPAPAAEAPSPVAGGGYRLTISRIGSATQGAAIAGGGAAGTAGESARASRAAAPAAQVQAAGRGLTPRPNALQFQFVATGSFTYGTRGAADAYRYVYTIYRVRNAAGAALTNLSLLATTTGAALGGSAISDLRLAGNVAPDAATGAALARSMLPAGASGLTRSGQPTASRADVLQVFPEGDLAALTLPAGYAPLPYGFSVLDTATDRRTLAATAAGAYPGLIVFAFRLPLQATASQDVFTFTYNFFAVTDAETRVTQSVEERDPASTAAVSTRATALGVAALHVFRGSALAGQANARVFCGVRTAGTRTSPAAVLGTSCAGDYRSIAVTPSPVTLNAGASQQLTATLTPADGAAPPMQVAYASADPSVATVSPTGLVTAAGPGSTTVYSGPYGSHLLTTTTVTVLAGPPVIDPASIAAGPRHSCALTVAGAAYCWGDNTDGQLGNGTTTPSAVPVAVAGGLTFKAIAAGGADGVIGQTCALTTEGRAYCWGAAQSNNGSIPRSTAPVPVPGTPPFTRITVGGNICGLDAAGQAYCWVPGNGGVFGSDLWEATGTPAPVAGGLRFIDIAAGHEHVCAVTVGRQAYCWGRNDRGQVGNGTTDVGWPPTPVLAPVRVSGGLSFTSITAGHSHTCALTDGGQAYCWGTGNLGALGTGSPIDHSSTPVAVAGTARYTRLTAGWRHTCGTTSGGQAYCWGARGAGQLGNGTIEIAIPLVSPSGSNVPVAVLGGLTFARLAAGVTHTCGITTDRAAYCWGNAHEGELGNGLLGFHAAPTAGTTFPPLVGVSTFGIHIWDGHTCGLATTGAAYCVGVNQLGQLGAGLASTYSTTPVEVAGGRAYKQVGVGWNRSCALTTEGKAYCWGERGLGNAASGGSSTPVAVAGDLTFGEIAVGNTHTCGVTTAGRVYCWGSTLAGALGTGVAGSSSALTPAPVDIASSITFASVTVGDAHSCALTTGGQAYCWGSSGDGKLGDGTFIDRPSPVPVQGALAFKRIVAGWSHTCALTLGGKAHCWGRNQELALGDGTTVERRNVPVAVSGDLTFQTLTAGWDYTCGLTTTGRAYCWGSNSEGASGFSFSTRDRSAVPVPVQGGLTFTGLTAGGQTTCGLEASTRRLYCWGLDNFAQSGDGTPGFATTPTRVLGNLQFGVP